MNKPLTLSSLILVALSALSLPAAAGKPAVTGNTPIGPCSVTSLIANADDCRGFVTGNDSASQLAALVGSSWHGLSLASLTQYKDDSVAVGSTTPVFDAVQSPTDSTQGTLTFLKNVTQPFLVTLKAGNEFAAFYYAHGVDAGTLLSFDVPGTRGAGFSHASVYAASSSITSAVPEPESYALMLAGLAAVGFVARRRA